MTRRVFDAYAALDFSARATPSPVKPSADAVWLGTAGASGAVRTTYCRTRQQGWEALRQWVRRQRREGRRVLIGVDFALGFPSGFARAAGMHRSRVAPWRLVWNEIGGLVLDQANNRNNRAEVAASLNQRVAPQNQPGPFWGMKPTSAAARLALRRGFDWPYGEQGLARLRLTEQRCPGTQEVWKLGGIGSVGGQTLLGIAGLAQLLREPGFDGLRVWPFETGFSVPGRSDAAGVVAEVFPSLLREEVSRAVERGVIRDQAQVRAWCRWARREDAAGRLAGFFAEPRGLTRSQQRACVREEGWVLGV